MNQRFHIKFEVSFKNSHCYIYSAVESFWRQIVIMWGHSYSFGVYTFLKKVLNIQLGINYYFKKFSAQDKLECVSSCGEWLDSAYGISGIVLSRKWTLIIRNFK